MAASLKVSELLSLSSVAASDLFLIADVDATASKKTTFSQLQSSISLANLGSNSIDDLSNVDITTVAPTEGQTLTWNNGDGEFQPANLPTQSSLSVDDLIALTGVTEGGVDLGVFGGNTITDNLTVRAALAELEGAVELRATISLVNEIDDNANDLITLTGVAENATDLGSFTGAIITDNLTVKSALQELETSLEATQGALSGGDGINLNNNVVAVDLTESYDAPVFANGSGQQIPYNGTYAPLGNFVLTGTGPYTFTANASYEAYYKKEFGQYDIVMIFNTTANRWEGFQVDFLANPSVETYVGGESISVIVDLGIATSETKNGYLSPDSADADMSYVAGGSQSFLEISGAKLKAAVLDEDTMSSDSATHLATQQSIKAYVDNADNTLFTNQAEIDANADDLITLSGVSENTTNLGSFTGSIIGSTQTIKSALQDLETEVELKQDIIAGGDGVNVSSNTVAIDLALTTASFNVKYLPYDQAEFDANPNAYSALTYDWELHPNFGVIDSLSGSLYLNTGAVGGVSTESAVDAIWWRVDPTNSSAYQLIGRQRLSTTTFGWYLFTGLTILPSGVTTNGGNFGTHDTNEDALEMNFTTAKQVGGKYYMPETSGDFIYEDSSLATSKKLWYRDRTDSGSEDEYDSPAAYDFTPVDGLFGFIDVTTNVITLDTAASTAQVFSKDNGDGTYTLMGRYSSTSGSHYTFTGVTTNPSTFAGTNGETLHTYADATELDDNRALATTGTTTVNGAIYPSDSYDMFVDTSTTDGSFLEFQNNKLAVSVLDEDNLVSDSAAHVPTQQSVKAYVDAANVSQDSTIAATYVNKDGSTVFTGAINAGGFRVTNQADPSLGSDSANKSYVDAATAGQGAFWTQARLDYDGNFDISTGGLAVIDSIQSVDGDRVFLHDQTDASENGIYIAAVGTWSRSVDADNASEFLTNKTIFIAEGNTHSGRIYAYTGADNPVIDTDDITFTLKSSAAQLADGAVSTAKLADLAVTSAKINDVATSKLTGTLLDATVAETNVTQHEAALTLDATQITTGTIANARISAASVTQHQGILSITESQISDLAHTTKADLDVDHIETLTGAGVAADDLGTFTGSTIADTSTIKTALQALETEVETKQVALTGTDGVDITGSNISIDLAASDDYTNLTVSGQGGSYDGAYTRVGNFAIAQTIGSTFLSIDGTAGYALYSKTGNNEIAVVYSIADDGWYTVEKTGHDWTASASADILTTLTGYSGGTTADATYDGLIAPTPSATYAYGAGSNLSYLEFVSNKLAVSVKDEDDMSSNSDQHVPTQQSIKAYVDTNVGSANALITELDANVDDLISLTGITENTANLGTFTGELIADNTDIKTALQTIETALESDRPGLLEVHNDSGVQLDKGKVVYVTGTHVSGIPTVDLADADGTGTMPAVGLVQSNIADGTSGFIVITGILENLDTDTFAWDAGTSLYVSATAGSLTSTRPTAAGTKVQRIGVVTRRSATQGSILIMGAGRTNDVTNELTALTGVNLGALDLGTFTGTIVTDSASIKSAIQELETHIENLPLTNLDIDGGNTGTIGSATLFIADENGAGTNTKVTSGDIANYVVGSKTIKDMANVGTVADTEPGSYHFLVVDASTGDIKILDKSFVVLEG